MTMSTELLRQLPKTDLHCHYDGSLRIETVIELARRHGIKLFSFDRDTLMEHMGYGRIRKTLVEYLYGFEPLVAVLQNKDDIERTFFEVCEDAARENVWHLELRYCPYLHLDKGLTPEEVVATCVQAAEKAERTFGMSVRQILCGLKNIPNHVPSIAELAVQFADRGVVGFDLAGPETGFPIKDHVAGIAIAKRHHLFITIHAGESTGPATIAEALHDASAHRVGHGTSLVHDERLLNYVVNHRIGIESCPISNLHTGSVKALREHPIKYFLERCVRVSINTDNRLCSDTTVTRELATLIEHLDLGIEHVHRLLQNGFKSAFLPYNERSKLLRKFSETWKQLVNKPA
jgi:adenosine deaminase